VSPNSPAERAGFRPGDRILDHRPRDRQAAPGVTRTYVVDRHGETFELSLTYAELPPDLLALRLTYVLVGLFYLVIGLTVFLQRSDRMGTLFFLICFLLTGIFANPPPPEGARFVFLTKLFHNLCVLFLPPVFLHFFLVFPQQKRLLVRHSRLAAALYAPVLALFASASFLDLVISRGNRITPNMLAFENVGSVFILLYYLLGILAFIHTFRTQQSLAMKRRLRYVLAGTVLGAGPFVVISLILGVWPAANIPGFRYSALPLLLIPLAFGHAIVRYRLMDLDIIVRRSVAYTLLTASLVAIYVGVVQGVGGYVLQLQGRLTLFLSVVSIFIIALLFTTLRDRIQRMVDRLFYMGRYSFPDTLRDFNQMLACPLGLSEILENLADRLVHVLKVENVAVLALQENQRTYAVAAESGLPSLALGNAAYGSDDDAVRWLGEEQIPLPIERLGQNPRFLALPNRERDTLDRMRTAALAPVISDRRLVAILSIGPRKSHELLSRQDLALVEAVASQTARTIETASLRQEKEAREKMQREMEIARDIQTRLLPKAPPQLEGLVVSGMNVPCQEVGGDYYDYIVLDEHRLGIAIADVSGKGVSAALLMATLQAAFRAEAETGKSPARVLSQANRRVLESFGPERFASLFYGVIDLTRMRLTYASAGHEAPLLLRAKGKIEALDTTGLVLGFTPEAEYEDREVAFHRGDTLLLYTDGVTEELNEDEELFGRRRLETVLAGVQGASPSETGERVLQAVRQFTMGSIQDDVTVVTVGFQ